MAHCWHRTALLLPPSIGGEGGGTPTTREAGFVRLNNNLVWWFASDSYNLQLANRVRVSGVGWVDGWDGCGHTGDGRGLGS